MKVSSFGKSIVLRCVRWGCEVRDAICGKITGESDVFATIISVEGLDGGVEIFFNNCSESYKNIFYIRLVFEGIEPNIFGEMVDKYYVVFEAIM